MSSFKRKQKLIFAMGIFLIGMPGAFASSEFKKVDKSLLVRSFDETNSQKEYLKKKEVSILDVFYGKLLTGLDKMKKTEIRYRTLWNLGTETSRYTSSRDGVEVAASTHMQHQLKVAFNYGLRGSSQMLTDITQGVSKNVDFFAFTKNNDSGPKDNIRYDLIATDIRANPNRLYRAELNSDDMEILRYIPKDHIEWGVEPVAVKDLKYQAAVEKPKGFWKTSPTSVKTSIRMIAPTQPDQMLGVVLGASALDNHYQVNYNTAAETQSTFVTHTFSMPFDKAKISSEFTTDFQLRRISTSAVRKSNAGSMSLNYYNLDNDIGAEMIIPGKDLEYIFGASISLD